MGAEPIIFLCCVVAGTCAGKAVGAAITAKRLYFEELAALARSISGDFRFRRTPVCELLRAEADSVKSDRLLKNVDEFVTYAESGGGELSLSGFGADSRDKRVVYEFFSSLGRYDADTQTRVLEGIAAKIAERAESATLTEKKWAGLAVRLGFLSGACAGILFL